MERGGSGSREGRDLWEVVVVVAVGRQRPVKKRDGSAGKSSRLNTNGPCCFTGHSVRVVDPRYLLVSLLQYLIDIGNPVVHAIKFHSTKINSERHFLKIPVSQTHNSLLYKSLITQQRNSQWRNHLALQTQNVTIEPFERRSLAQLTMPVPLDCRPNFKK